MSEKSHITANSTITLPPLFSDALQIHMMTHTGEKPHKFDPYFGVLTSLPYLAIFGEKKMIIFGRLESVKTTVSCLSLTS